MHVPKKHFTEIHLKHEETVNGTDFHTCTFGKDTAHCCKLSCDLQSPERNIMFFISNNTIIQEEKLSANVLSKETSGLTKSLVKWERVAFNDFKYYCNYLITDHCIAVITHIKSFIAIPTTPIFHTKQQSP